MRQLDLVCLTLDGSPEVHDRQRRAGSHARVISAIETLRRLGVPIVTMTVLTPSGADVVDDVLEVARSYGFSAFFQLEHDKTSDVLAPLAPRLSDRRIAHLMDHLIARKKSGAPVGNSLVVLEQQRERRYLGTCEDCYAGRYYAYVLSDGTVAPCLLTQWQQEPGNGRARGFVRAFEELAAPTGPGCSCVPSHEVNRMLSVDPRALWHAVEVTLGGRV
jgi:MoaA/NifB/PqqE/SkfB family radical SAM enzyme